MARLKNWLQISTDIITVRSEKSASAFFSHLTIIIKYFMVLYLGLLLLFSSLYFKDLKMFGNGLLLALFYSAYDLIWTYVRDRVWYLPVSSWISAFVLAIAALPNPS